MYPRSVIGVLFDVVWGKLVINMLTDVMSIGVVTIDTFLFGVLVVVGVETSNGVDVLANNVNENVLTAVMTKFVVSARLEESVSFCWAPFGCWAVIVWDCSRC